MTVVDKTIVPCELYLNKANNLFMVLDVTDEKPPGQSGDEYLRIVLWDFERRAIMVIGVIDCQMFHGLVRDVVAGNTEDNSKK